MRSRGLFALIVRPDLAGMLAVVTGGAMVVFELVEIAVVGFVLAEYGVAEPVAWLQVAYIAIGLATIGDGAAPWDVTADDRRRRVLTGNDPLVLHR